MDYVIWCMLGTMYGMLIGIAPMAGATTGLLTVFSLSHYFLANPYLGIVFLTSLVASSSTGDSFTSILTGIPGSNTTAASVIDGHQMALNGQAGRALGIAIMDSTVNGVLWGVLAFAFLPFYAKGILMFGIPEFAGFMILSLACVGFITSKNVLASIAAIALGCFLGLIGEDPATGIQRYTFGWDYLGAGIQIIPIIAGLFGIPELVDGFQKRSTVAVKVENYWQQLMQGFRDCFVNWRDMLRGGFIGFFTGLLPGVGGTIGDIMAYGATVAKHPMEKFGNGNPRGLLGCEGANNAQKAASMVPAVLFGIPAAPFAAVMMAICMYFGMELGTPELLKDNNFFWALGGAFIASTILAFFLSIFTTQIIVKLLEIPYWIYAVVIFAIIVWSCMQYSGTINDLYMLIICGTIGLVAKWSKLSRPAIMVAFILIEKLENYSQQMLSLYTVAELFARPIFSGLLVTAVGIFIYSIFRSNRGLAYH